MMNGTSDVSWRRLRDMVKSRDKAICYHCGKVAEDGHCDHLIPLAKGGTDSVLNLVWSCDGCNHSKSDKVLEPRELTELELSLMPKKRGGKRQGAGRPSELKDPKRVTIILEGWQLEWVKAQGETSEIIRGLIGEAANDTTK